MSEARISQDMSTGLVRVMERARRNPQERQCSLAYLIDVEALRRSFDRIRKRAAVGVDGATKEEYGQNLEENLRDRSNVFTLRGCLTSFPRRRESIFISWLHGIDSRLRGNDTVKKNRLKMTR